MKNPAVGIPGLLAQRRVDRFRLRVGAGHGARAARYVLPALIAVFCLASMTPVPVRGSEPPNSLPLIATYDVGATIQWSAATMDVSSTAHVQNTTDAPVDALTFNLAAQRIGSVTLGDVTADGQPAVATVDDQSVIVQLPSAVDAGDLTDVTITYHAAFNTTGKGHRYQFARYKDVLTAYRWIPWLSLAQKFYPRGDRESWVTGVSPQVNVTLTSDTPLDIAASGQRTANDGYTTQTFSATNVRDFNFSASAAYRIMTRTWHGITIRLLYTHLRPKFTMRWAIRALTRYTNEVGPYPYATLDIGEIPTGVGMESPGMVWIDSSLPRRHLPYIIVHELAHEWFYGVVGNNQGLDPFVDEAMADFLARNLLNSWQRSRCAPQPLGNAVYDYGPFCYYEVIYVQGSEYLRDYMNQVGTSAFWTGVQNFYSDYRFAIADTRALWQELDAASGWDSSQHDDRFPGLF